jgi:hypothetical protein
MQLELQPLPEDRLHRVEIVRRATLARLDVVPPRLVLAVSEHAKRHAASSPTRYTTVSTRDPGTQRAGNAPGHPGGKRRRTLRYRPAGAAGQGWVYPRGAAFASREVRGIRAARRDASRVPSPHRLHQRDQERAVSRLHVHLRRSRVPTLPVTLREPRRRVRGSCRVHRVPRRRIHTTHRRRINTLVASLRRSRRTRRRQRVGASGGSGDRCDTDDVRVGIADEVVPALPASRTGRSEPVLHARSASRGVCRVRTRHDSTTSSLAPAGRSTRHPAARRSTDAASASSPSQPSRSSSPPLPARRHPSSQR